MDTPVLEPPKKENRTWAIVGSIAAIVLCGLTGLCLLCPLSVVIFTGTQNSAGYSFSNTYGIIPLCLSIVFIAIGVVVPILLLRKKKPADEFPTVPPSTPTPPMPPQEPLPPAS